MRVLLLSVTAGQGHNSCARSVMSALEERGVECQMVDTIKYINEWTGDAIDKGYLSMGKHTPKVWGGIYNQTLNFSIHARPGFRRMVLPPVPNRLVRLIRETKPDAILCTHVFASLLLTRLRRKGRLSIPVIGINTDFTLHPFWEEVDEDYLVLACDKMHYAVQKRGIPSQKTLPFGIPVNSVFKKQIDKKEARIMLGLPEKTTMLLMGGSMGFGDMVKQVIELDALPFDFQVVVICGSNKTLYEELSQRCSQKQFRKTVFPYQFVDNVNVFMYGSDIICTKPGGLSISESLSVGRPLVMLDPIPGLEDINAAFLVNCGVAVQTGKHYTLSEAVYNLLSSPERVAFMLSAQEKISPRLAADTLSDFLIDMIRRREESCLHYDMTVFDDESDGQQSNGETIVKKVLDVPASIEEKLAEKYRRLGDFRRKH